MREMLHKYHYIEVNTPQIMDRVLWERSGHWDKYAENMFTTKSENRDYAIKPMNCPGAIQIFNSRTRSYRDLPIEWLSSVKITVTNHQAHYTVY